jgi:hypothetical protein
VRSRPLASLLVALALAAAACGADGQTGDGQPGETPGEAAQARADKAMGALCEIASGDLQEMADVAEAFHGRAHTTISAVATRVQELDPAAAGALLEARALLEADVDQATPPPDLQDHAQALIAEFASALETAGLNPAACGQA